MKKNILIISFSDLQFDARVSRQISFLQEDYNIILMAYGQGDLNNYKFIKISPSDLGKIKKAVAGILLLLRLFKPAYKLLYPYQRIISNIDVDLIIANDVETLPLAFRLSRNKLPVLFDAHEYAPRHFEDQKWFRIFFQRFNTFLCKKYIPKVVDMTTVSPGLVNEYYKNFGKKPHLILNAPSYEDIHVSKTTNPIRIIHHGGATRSRKLEVMIEIMKYLDKRYELYLMLLVPPRASETTLSYIDELKNYAKDFPNIYFIPPVKHDKVVDEIRKFDIGLFLLEPVNFNYKYTVPNKLLEFIQARLAVAIGPSPDMKKIVENYKCGIVTEDFTPLKMAEALNKLSPQEITSMKKFADLAAKELNAQTTGEKFKEIVNKILFN